MNADGTWTHPTLGTFEYDGHAWLALTEAPGFDVFSEPDERRRPGSKRQYRLAFYEEDEDQLPSPEAVELALKVLSRAETLARMVADALWEDFNGRGPDSGMWWHAGLDEVNDGLDGVAPPVNRADDLFKCMSLTNIAIRSDVYKYAGPVVELRFSTPFEEEHNVGVLTDGERIVGTGYSHDVEPFPGFEKPPR